MYDVIKMRLFSISFLGVSFPTSPPSSIFNKQGYSIIRNVHFSVCKKSIGRNVIISAAIHVRRLIIFVKVFYTDKHSVYNLLGPSVCRSCYKRPKHIMSKMFRDFLRYVFIYNTEYLLYNPLCTLVHSQFFYFATYGFFCVFS